MASPGAISPRVQRAPPRGAMLPAGDAVRENGWGLGTTLGSVKWKRPRDIEEISKFPDGRMELKLRAKGHGGCAWVTTVPGDTPIHPETVVRGQPAGK